jgi:membrane complex biogenesis BtpA family protein
MRFREHGPALVGVIHLSPLPGSPRSSLKMSSLRARTAEDALALAAAGFDAVLVENFGDAPFFRDAVPPETVAAMAVLVGVARSASGLPVGVNILRNDGASALAVAVATEARFIRVNILAGARVADQGVIQTDAARLLRMRRHLDAAGVGIVADVGVKHSAPLGASGDEAVAEEAVEVVERALADVVVVTGVRTGAEADERLVSRVKRAVPSHPVWLGSGVRVETAARWSALADGVIVGSALREGGRAGGPIDAARALAFAKAWRGEEAAR